MRKLSKFFILTFPLLLPLAMALGGNLTSAFNFDSVIPLSDTFIYGLFVDLFDIVGFSTTAVSYNYLAWIFSYLVIYTILDIAFHVLVFLPKLGKKFIEDICGTDI